MHINLPATLTVEYAEETIVQETVAEWLRTKLS